EPAPRVAVGMNSDSIFETVSFLADRAGDDVPVNLELLARPVALAANDLIYVFVVLHALAESRVQQDSENSGEHQGGNADLCGFVAHRMRTFNRETLVRIAVFPPGRT